MITEGSAGSRTREQTEQLVLAAVRGLVDELGGRPGAVRPDADLERELGLGSLERVELLSRIEQALSTELPDRALSDAHTPAALVDLSTGGDTGPREGRAARPSGEEVVERVVGAESWGDPGVDDLVGVVRFRATVDPDGAGVRLLGDDLAPRPLTHAALQRRGERIAAALAARGVGPGDRVALVFPTCLAFFPTFVGILAAGAVPVPIYPPVRMDGIEAYLDRHGAILADAGVAAIVTDRQLEPIGEALAVRVAKRSTGRRAAPVAVTVERLEADRTPAAGSQVLDPQGLALLQYTSGSTGDPKGVALTHANLLANMRAIGKALELAPGDVCVSWLPLYHDMGLIGSWLTAFLHGVPLVLLSPLQFLSRPARWLRAIDRYRATVSPAPNFGYELAAAKVADREVAGLDLSSWRYAMNGSEPVRRQTVERFAERFAAAGFRAEAMHPAYGLAENSVAVALPPVGRGVRYDRIERERFQRDRRAVPVAVDGGTSEQECLTFVAVGPPVDTCQVRIVDRDAPRGAVPEALPERVEGRVLFAGPSAMGGYFERPDATAAVRWDGWTDTGDLGYLADGELFVTGRIKDLVIKGGRNYHPHDIEDAATVAGVRKGCVAAFGVVDETGERLVVVAETREPEERHQQLEVRLTEAVATAVGTPPDRVVLAGPGTVPKTSSGKIRRRETRERYLAGTLEARRARGGRGVVARGLPFVRLAAGLVRARLRRLAGRARDFLFGLRALAVVLVVLTPVTLRTIVLARRPERAWAILHRGLARAFRWAGVPIEVRGRLDEETAVLVSNHASYLDALVLLAAFGPESTLALTSKREVFGWPFVARVLARLDVVPIDRGSATGRLGSLAAAGEALDAGRVLHVFPESTFTRTPGVRPFRLGAFSLAVERGLPVIPVGLAGTRRALPAGALLPRRERIVVTVGEPLRPPAADAELRQLVALRDRARRAVAEAAGEPLLEVTSAALPAVA